MASSSRSSSAPVDEEKGTQATATTNGAGVDEFPTATKLVLIMVAIYLAMFLVALDKMIIGTAIPEITNDFHSITDVGWYASAYILTNSSFLLIYGRIYTFYTIKWVLFVAIGLFELGSLVCAVAPTSTGFILGRAVAGLGSAGVMSGCMGIMIISVPLHKRPMYQGLAGSVFGIASVAGPLLGGVFTSDLTWRFCFWINLPIGGVVVAVLLLILKTPPSKDTDTLRQRFKKLDPLGTAVFLPAMISLLLALQWGGITYDWANARIIVLFILFAVLIFFFAMIQVRSGDNATIPTRIISQRSILSGMYFSVVVAGAMITMSYFLPLYFQAIKGVSAVRSGIDTLPMLIALVVATIVSGIVTRKTGYYVPQMITSSVVMSIGAGLLTTLQVDTSSAKWIGYQILLGFGMGLGLQQPGMAAQSCLSKIDVMTGVSIMFFMQGLGGSIFVSISQAIFNKSLVSKLTGIADLDPATIISTGATDLRRIVPATELATVLIAYNGALSDVFKVATGCAAVSILGALTMEWKNIKGLKEGGPTGEKEVVEKVDAQCARKSGDDIDVDAVTIGEKTVEPKAKETSVRC